MYTGIGIPNPPQASPRLGARDSHRPGKEKWNTSVARATRSPSSQPPGGWNGCDTRFPLCLLCCVSVFSVASFLLCCGFPSYEPATRSTQAAMVALLSRWARPPGSACSALLAGDGCPSGGHASASRAWHHPGPSDLFGKGRRRPLGACTVPYRQRRTGWNDRNWLRSRGSVALVLVLGNLSSVHTST